MSGTIVAVAMFRPFKFRFAVSRDVAYDFRTIGKKKRLTRSLLLPLSRYSDLSLYCRFAVALLSLSTFGQDGKFLFSLVWAFQPCRKIVAMNADFLRGV